MNEFHKQPGEVETTEVTFDQRMAIGETIATKTITAVETKHDTDKTTTVINSSTISLSNTSVYVKVKDGTDGIDYKITVIVTTSGGNTLEEDVLMRVYEV